MPVSNEEIKRTFEEQLRYTHPDLMINLIITLGELMGSGLFNTNTNNTLRDGRAQLMLLVGKALQEGKIKIFHADDIRLDADEDAGDHPYRLPSIDLCQYFGIFNSNYDGIAYMRAAGIISAANTDAEHSAWYPRFKTEEEAKRFVSDFHELFVWTTFWKSSLFEQTNLPTHLKPCMAAIDHYTTHKDFGPLANTIQQNEELKSDPNAFVQRYGGEISFLKNGDVVIVNDWVAYRWKKKEQAFEYSDYCLVRWDGDLMDEGY